jgi:hypothetical protein
MDAVKEQCWKFAQLAEAPVPIFVWGKGGGVFQNCATRFGLTPFVVVALCLGHILYFLPPWISNCTTI